MKIFVAVFQVFGPPQIRGAGVVANQFDRLDSPGLGVYPDRMGVALVGARLAALDQVVLWGLFPFDGAGFHPEGQGRECFIVGAGAFQVHNEGVKMTPIKVDSGARNAYDDARMLRLQVSSATGIPGQYFGDISSGNLATAKTVELPMLKMFQSMQQVWEDFYRSIDEAVLLHNKIAPDKWYVDINWPPIAPKDIASMADALSKVVATFPQMGDSEEVMMVALNTLGIDDVSEVIDNMAKQAKSNGYAEVARGLRKIQKEFKEMDNARKEEGS